LNFYREENQRIKDKDQWGQETYQKELDVLREDNTRLREDFQEEKDVFSQRKQEFSSIGEELQKA